MTRHYVIADDYSWLQHTTDPKRFGQIVETFIITMKNSSKMNSYRVFTEDITKDEMEVIERNKKYLMNKKHLGIV